MKIISHEHYIKISARRPEADRSSRDLTFEIKEAGSPGNCTTAQTELLYRGPGQLYCEITTTRVQSEDGAQGCQVLDAEDPGRQASQRRAPNSSCNHPSHPLLPWNPVCVTGTPGSPETKERGAEESEWRFQLCTSQRGRTQCC